LKKGFTFERYHRPLQGSIIIEPLSQENGIENYA